MVGVLVLILVLFPLLAALLLYIVKAAAFRSIVVFSTAALLAASSLMLFPGVPFTWTPEIHLKAFLDSSFHIADFIILVVILFCGVRHKNIPVVALSVAQVLLVLYLGFFFGVNKGGYPLVYCDHLSLVMVLIVSIVGSIIVVYAIPYMKTHETHLELRITRQHAFFSALIMFLSAMNGMVLSNDLAHFYFFFELTTLCSFLLIGHDRTETAIKNAIRALWMNSLGGLTLLCAMVWISAHLGALDMQQIIHYSPGASTLLLPLSLLCFAAFIKSAQVPFQDWLLGAMVAPTPVSALLHSSTMVKAGVYLVLRLAPAFAGTFLSLCVGLFGAFTFLSAAALAVGQSNAKKILAYSTVSNLGLILCCAGLNSRGAITAAILLMMFHAVSKALLFLCVGTIEQHISSRDIEDMQGLYIEMPFTAMITVLGAMTMILPPFGMVLGKWMAMESAVMDLSTTFMLTLGSSLTVVYWARWAGILMSAPFAGRLHLEKQSIMTRGPLVVLCTGAMALGFMAPWLYLNIVLPALGIASSSSAAPFSANTGILANSVGSFAVHPLFLIAVLGFASGVVALARARNARFTAPYLGGVQTSGPGVFRGPMTRDFKAEVGGYYLPSIFGEDRLTVWANLGAGALLILMVGGAL